MPLTNQQSFLNGYGALAITLEKNSTLAQTGAPISANRDLSVDITVSQADNTYLTAADSVRYDVYVDHTATVAVFLDSVIVRK
jgi:hypothetical protein